MANIDEDLFQAIANAIVDTVPDLVTTWPPGTLARITRAVYRVREKDLARHHGDDHDHLSEVDQGLT